MYLCFENTYLNKASYITSNVIMNNAINVAQTQRVFTLFRDEKRSESNDLTSAREAMTRHKKNTQIHVEIAFNE